MTEEVTTPEVDVETPVVTGEAADQVDTTVEAPEGAEEISETEEVAEESTPLGE